MDTDKLIQERDGDLFIGPSRVLVENIVITRNRGSTPEEIQQSFPSLSLEQVLGAIIYYLEHKEDLDARFEEEQRVRDALHAANRAAHAEFFDAMHARFEAARQERREHPERYDEVAEA